MRYAQRGGYTPAEQRRRERLRLQAAGRFARGDKISESAGDLRVTQGSVRRWRRAWRDGGAAALRSRGPVSRERLSPRQWARLETELRKGPLAHGFASDQRWTLGRIKTLIGKLFRVGYTAEGTWNLMPRHGWSAQVPVRQSMEPHEAAVARGRAWCSRGLKAPRQTRSAAPRTTGNGCASPGGRPTRLTSTRPRASGRCSSAPWSTSPPPTWTAWSASSSAS